jgi:hypothetical protein
MDEIALLRTLDTDVDPGSVSTREAARRRLLTVAAAVSERERRPTRRRLLRGLGMAFGAASLALAFVFSLAVWPIPFLPRSGPDAAASDIFRRAADSAARKPVPAATGYRYTKSQGAWMSYAMVSSNGSGNYKLLRPITREIWIAPDGSGRIRETVGEATFFTEADRANWVAAGSPAGLAINEDFGPGGLYYAANSDLPTEPILLRAMLLARALGTQVPPNVEMFILVGDSLRETVPEPRLRSALFQVAATIDGVEVLGPTTDRTGRAGVAVGITGGAAGARMQYVLIFDPVTYDLLGEEERAVDATGDGIPAGSVIGYSTYLASDVVPSLP